MDYRTRRAMRIVALLAAIWSALAIWQPGLPAEDEGEWR
jgi:hypothetical protein